MEMSWPKAFLIQFLNIAGTGPIFGAVAGALWGPAAFIWIVFGCIFAGSVHDFLLGMMSLRRDGASVSEIVGENLGLTAKQIMRVFLCCTFTISWSCIYNESCSNPKRYNRNKL